MSVILRKKSQSTSGLSTSEKKMKEMIESQIKNILNSYFGIERSIFLRKTQYFLVFSTCKFSEEKSISSVFIKGPSHKDYEKISADEIEIAGVTIVEFLDFMNEKGAKESTRPVKLLEAV